MRHLSFTINNKLAPQVESHTDDLNGMETESGTDCVHELSHSLCGGRSLDLQHLLIGESWPPFPILLSRYFQRSADQDGNGDYICAEKLVESLNGHFHLSKQ